MYLQIVSLVYISQYVTNATQWYKLFNFYQSNASPLETKITNP